MRKASAVVKLLLVSIIVLLVYTIYTPNYSNIPDETPVDFTKVPIIFVGGHESTGTGLMRVLLDAHPWIRCGAEAMINMDILEMRSRMSQQDNSRAKAAGYYPDGLDRAIASFIYQITLSMGPPARRLCHKVPRSLDYVEYLHKIFPNAKFIHMVRDGRAVVDSTIRRGFRADTQIGSDDFAIQQWEMVTRMIFVGCQNVGKSHCMSIRYEHLVMHPEKVMRRVLAFLRIPWDNVVLHHEKVLKNITNLISFEPSTPQVKMKIHTKSLSLWYGEKSSLQRGFIENIHKNNSLLKELGYAALGFPPNYEKLPYELPYVWLT